MPKASAICFCKLFALMWSVNPHLLHDTTCKKNVTFAIFVNCYLLLFSVSRTATRFFQPPLMVCYFDMASAQTILSSRLERTSEQTTCLESLLKNFQPFVRDSKVSHSQLVGFGHPVQLCSYHWAALVLPYIYAALGLIICDNRYLTLTKFSKLSVDYWTPQKDYCCP